jgi:hypothetical protein
MTWHVCGKFRKSAWIASYVAALSLFLQACAGSRAFGPTFPDNRQEDLAPVLARLKAEPAQIPAPVLVGATQSPREVFAYDLEHDRLLWKKPLDPVSVPLVAGRHVVVSETTRVLILDLESGEVQHELASQGLGVIGADGDDKLAAIVLTSGATMGARSRLIALRGDQIVLDRAVAQPLGGPAVAAGLIFLPWNRIYLSALDDSGRELARIRVQDDVVSQALTQDGQVFFGEAGIFKLDERSANGKVAEASYFRIGRKDKLPGNPPFLTPADKPPAPVDSALHRVSLRFAPAAEGDRVHLADDNLYLSFYSQIFALDPMSNGARWVYQTQSDVVGVHAVSGGLFVLEQSGKLAYLDAEGHVRHTAQLDLEPVVGHFRAQRFSGPGSGGEVAPLALQLVEAATNPDTRLVPARVMAVSMLAMLQDADATRALVALCQDRAGPEKVRKTACVELSRRTTSSDALIEALSQHANYLTEEKAPPVGPLAEAAARTGDKRAVPHLIAHLEDPYTSAEELPALMLALKTLDDPSALEPAGNFLKLYHAEADEPNMESALIIAIQMLTKQASSTAARNLLEPIANDSLGSPMIRAGASKALAELAETEAPSTTAQEPTPGRSQVDAPIENGPPERLNLEHVRTALLPVQEKLSQCVRSDPKRPPSARLTIVIDGAEGKVLAVKTLPETLNACVVPLVMNVAFPITRHGRRETVTYQISR